MSKLRFKTAADVDVTSDVLRALQGVVRAVPCVVDRQRSRSRCHVCVTQVPNPEQLFAHAEARRATGPARVQRRALMRNARRPLPLC